MEKETEMLKQSIVSLENELKRITTQLKDVEERNCLLYSTSMEKVVKKTKLTLLAVDQSLHYCH